MISGLQQFEFEIVAIDRQGEIVERSIQRAQQVAEDLGNGVILEMVVIPGGMFRMGSRESQGYADEHPQHSVRVAAFLMAKYPVTQEQWAAVMDWTPPYRCRGAQTAGGPRLLARFLGILPAACGQDGTSLPPAQRGRVGIRLPGRHHHTVLRRRDPYHRPGELRRRAHLPGRAEGSLSPRDDGCWQLSPERLWVVRYARQRLGMVRRRLARRL